jgi:small conductance mechanosensitive channel
MDDVLTTIYSYLATYGLKILAAIIIFIIGRWVAKLISKLIHRALIKSKFDETLAHFVTDFSYFTMLIIVGLTALSIAGVPITSFAVIIGAAGLAIGFAWQGSLANFAAGIMLIIFKPFKVGDFIEAAGQKGTVKQVLIFNTIINSPDNVKIIIPNSQVTGGNIMNYTANGTRRVDLVIGVSYEDDLKKTHEVINNVLAGDDRILGEPTTTVAVSGLGDSSVNFVVRPWVKAGDYWSVYFDLTEKIKIALDENGITIPFPQRDIHIINGTDKVSVK